MMEPMGFGLLSLLVSALWITLRLGRCEACARPFHSMESLVRLIAQEGTCTACRSGT